MTAERISFRKLFRNLKVFALTLSTRFHVPYNKSPMVAAHQFPHPQIVAIHFL